MKAEHVVFHAAEEAPRRFAPPAELRLPQVGRRLTHQQVILDEDGIQLLLGDRIADDCHIVAVFQ